ncbi:MAG: hypothetical protein ACI8W3_000861 [Myxococcota bacterium]|jgi:hypothetical protein
MSENPARFTRAIAAIDDANAGDPNRIEVRGEDLPKELAHADLATLWAKQLVDTPSEALLLAVRAHHLRRWSLPRSDYPTGRSGYLTWRQALKQRHADEAAAILTDCNYEEETIDEVSRIILRKNLIGDAQVLEDAVCLVFFETQLVELANRLNGEKMKSVGLKTLRKMTPAARQMVLELPLAPAYIELLRELNQSL